MSVITVLICGLYVVGMPILCVADAVMETFDALDPAWEAVGFSSVSYDSVFRGDYPRISMPWPTYGSLVVTSELQNGSMIGSYVSNHVWLTGFSFRYLDEKPLMLKFEIKQGSQTFFREMSCCLPPTTGVWRTYVYYLGSSDSGGWAGSLEGFVHSDLTNLTSMAIRLARNSTEPQSYEIDNVFVGPFPSIQFSSSPDGLQPTVYNLVSNVSYALSYSTNLVSSPWQSATNWTANSSRMTWTHADFESNAFRVFSVGVDVD